ncbi:MULTISPECIES: nucleotidyltransferase domain-containing protein [unclassified Oceanispirochaeta]|uniref:type VII toxin-antitoxin system MntA family adenylyltransferase antitoxin n=1 Tax=unclassified Oceanispirochaeta TaxID=2635722 RepID=UPI000E08D301|nr:MULTISPECIES: nucleotidyltransferase domain-containing protein [unclassified Oceanispirochaeta]MBF9017781.1 nucleotidyltransferase domain-containing protein [Oceanispirochaeta sp. M2]NPD74345.1 nucleotidyltransferase domain-containing protein [Oceanispirochaeta sp. M1]RDG29825.1 nucleotidyltransferase domain-containing protein [Oceanispirochaeta sp. M1]
MERGEILSSISSYFESREEIHTVIVYGSVADGSSGRDSDVDIALASFTALDYKILVQMNADLQIRLHRNIDLIDLDKAKGLIHYKIISKGVRLKYSSRELTGHMIRALDFKTDFLPQLQAMQIKRIEKTAYGT